MAREIELKLGVPPKSLKPLLRALAKRSGKAPATAELVSTYYDTADLELKRRSLTLRIRQQDGHFIQGVKSARDGPIGRGEWEEEITGARPNLQARHTGRHLPKQIKRRRLAPLFTTKINRTQLDLQPRRASRIEAAIDRGEIRAADDDRSAPIHELELELKQGRSADLYDLALQLYKTVPLEIGTASKAERGYGLIDPHSAPAARRQEPIELAPNCSADAMLRLIGRSCLGHLLNNIPAALAGEEEGIHQMRIAARRLRSLLSAAQKLLPDGQQRWASQELKYLADALGGARNWDSVTNSLIPDAQAGLAQPDGLAHLVAAASRCRTVAYQKAQDSIRSRHYGRSILRLLRWFETGGWHDEASRKQARLLREAAEPTAARLLERCRERLRKRSRKFDEQSPAERHRLRIAAKKLRYNIAFFASLYPRKQSDRFVARLQPLQNVLGQANDVRTAPGLMQDLKRPGGGSRARLEQEIGLLLGWHARGAKDCEQQTAEALRQLDDTKPFWR